MNYIDFANYADANTLDNACGNVDVVAEILGMLVEKLF